MKALFGRAASPEEFEAAVQKAKAAGVSAQLLLEAKVAQTIYAQDTEALVALLDPLQKLGPNLDLKGSQIFYERSDYDSFVQALLALQAEQKGDAAAFETHIKESLWLAPVQFQPLFLGWLNRHRDNEAMKKITVPLDLKLNTSDGKQTTLKEVLGANKAVLLDFWATWCAPCMVLMDGLNAKGAKLAPQGVVLVGLNTESDAAKAEQIKQQKNITLPWLVEPEGLPISTLLRADPIPRTVLISPEGKVLFNGHPSDPALKTALAKLGATL